MNMAESKTQQKVEQLSAEQTAVLQLVTIAPEPRTADELAGSYAGQATGNLWPEQDEDSVRSALDALQSKGLVKEGDKDPEGNPTIVLSAATEKTTGAQPPAEQQKEE
jgi:hypothetical protein